jgi:hypothetical protein
MGESVDGFGQLHEGVRALLVDRLYHDATVTAATSMAWAAWARERLALLRPAEAPQGEAQAPPAPPWRYHRTWPLASRPIPWKPRALVSSL